MDHMFLQAPEVIHKIRADGCVKDSFLDELQICKLQGDLHINRDDLVTWRQHAHVLSHTASKTAFVDYILLRDERNDPVLRQQKKLQAQAARVIQRDAAVQKKAELAAREKEKKHDANWKFWQTDFMKIFRRIAVNYRYGYLATEWRFGFDAPNKK